MDDSRKTTLPVCRSEHVYAATKEESEHWGGGGREKGIMVWSVKSVYCPFSHHVCLVCVQYGCCRFGVAFRVSRWVRGVGLWAGLPRLGVLPWPGGSVSSPTPHCREPFPRWLRLSAAWLRLLHKTSPPPLIQCRMHASRFVLPPWLTSVSAAPLVIVVSAQFRVELFGAMGNQISVKNTNYYDDDDDVRVFLRANDAFATNALRGRAYRVVSLLKGRGLFWWKIGGSPPPPDYLSCEVLSLSINWPCIIIVCCGFSATATTTATVDPDYSRTRTSGKRPNFFQIFTIVVNFHRIFAIFIPRR